jgi:hypothetical protein
MITSTKESWVRFTSVENGYSPEYIGPFQSEDDAYDYADDRNYGLSLAGVPGDEASYGVV